MTELNKGYGSEVFVSDGYGYFDDAVAAIATALREERMRTIEECAKVAEEYWKGGKNVYARHAGRAVESRIRALKDKP